MTTISGWTVRAVVALALLSTIAPPTAPRAAGAEPPATGLVEALEQSLVETIARCEPSVVAIARVRREPPDAAARIEPRPDFFGRRPLTLPAAKPTDPDFAPTAYATGVVIDPGGSILTAAHVLVEDSDYYVTTAERKVYRAAIKAADPRSDLAVLAVEATDLRPIALGDADRLRKGQIVVALGNPFGIARDGQASASWGIVANLHRKAPPGTESAEDADKPTLHHFGTLIQTDARLNLATSGGALVDLQGRMVGLTVALVSVPGYTASAGYAIPIDARFRRAIDTLKQGREVEYGFLGVQPVDLTAAERLAGMHGMRVDRVVPGTPAERHGLRAGDLITAVNGKPIEEADALVLEVGSLPVEAAARLDVVRDGRPRSIEVTLTKYPVRGRKVVTVPAPAWRGLRVDYPTVWPDADLRRPSGASFEANAVVVVDVEEGSPAFVAGVRRGMFITHVGSTAVRTPREFRHLVEQAAGHVQLRIRAAGVTTVLSVGP